MPEHETECDYDYLEILDGDNYSAPVIGRYCGHQVSACVECDYDYLEILDRDN